jgi:hypothetical protein
MSVTLINLLWSTAHVKSQICLTRLCKHDGQRWRKVAANWILWSIVFNCFVSQQVFTAGTKNKHQHLQQSENQVHVHLLLNILILVPQLCTELASTLVKRKSSCPCCKSNHNFLVVYHVGQSLYQLSYPPSGSHAYYVSRIIHLLITQRRQKSAMIYIHSRKMKIVTSHRTHVK